jgi:hypothetical protein
MLRVVRRACDHRRTSPSGWECPARYFTSAAQRLIEQVRHDRNPEAVRREEIGRVAVRDAGLHNPLYKVVVETALFELFLFDFGRAEEGTGPMIARDLGPGR